MRRLLWAGVLVCVFARAETGRWAEPSGFFENERITRATLAPGLAWVEAAGVRDGVPVETQVLDVELRPGAGLRLETLAGSRQGRAGSRQYFLCDVPSRMLRDPGALAALNASFFDIKSTQTPFGLVVRDGWLLREPAERYLPALLALADGRAVIGSPGWSGRVRVRDEKGVAREMPLAGVNRPSLQEREAVLFCPPWKRAPDAAAPFLGGRETLEIIARRKAVEPAPAGDGGGVSATVEVVEVRVGPGRASRALADDEMALVAGARAAAFFQGAGAGAVLEIEWRLTGLPEGVRTRDVRHALAGSTLLIAAGKLQEGGGGFWTARHPRSAAGVSADGRRALLVLVDGRTASSAGMSLGTLRDYMAHLGANDALNFDGGGSSAMVALPGGGAGGGARVLNRPSDGRERPVPTALGVRGP
ncbi:MAG: phosphodiester glycosidase family protein [Opitutaceae bacterium]|nr:phosphodiester glycosidase family protein [Opitutaceae bacterium]